MGLAKPFFAVAIVALGIAYQFFLQPFLYNRAGIGRSVEAINNKQCTRITEAGACEDAWLHQPSGKVYMTCAPLENKYAWLPNANTFKADKIKANEYIAIMDTKSQDGKHSITRVKTPGFKGKDGKGTLLLHGMGVYLGQDGLGNDDSLRLFLINHRTQPDAETKGADSVVELFETSLGSDTMTHIRTYSHPAIKTPNNLVPTGPDSFYFTNDHSVKIGEKKKLDFLLPGSSIGHCDKEGCKIVLEKVMYANGLAGGKHYPSRQPNVLYQSSTGEEFVTVYDVQADRSLTVKDKIRTGYLADNINLAQDQSLLVAAFPKILPMGKILTTSQADFVVPSASIQIAKNTGKDAFYGQKYTVSKLFEDDGNVASAMTNVVMDTERNMLILSGIVTPYVSICKI